MLWYKLPLRQKHLTEHVYDDRFVLSTSEYKEAIIAAKNGDGRAAYKLYWHYAAGLGDAERKMFWLRRSAELDYQLAQEVLELYETDQIPLDPLLDEDDRRWMRPSE